MARTKKEIDKELMYKKLMPSALRSVKALAEEPAPESAAPVEQVLYGQGVSPAPHKKPAGREVSVPALDNKQMVVTNVMESAVLGKLDSVLERFTCCRCDRCKKDIVALALNKLPPKYMVLPGNLPPPDLDPQMNAQVVTAMIQAVLRVRQSPRH